MNEHPEDLKEQKLQIMAQTAELSRLLGMIPSDDTIEVHEPGTQNTMALSNWLSATRDSFLRLTASISKTLDIPIQ